MIASRAPEENFGSSQNKTKEKPLPNVDSDNPTRVATRAPPPGKRGGRSYTEKEGVDQNPPAPEIPFPSMHNEPPTRLTMTLPTTQPMAVITGSGGPNAIVIPHYETRNTELGEPREGVSKHNLLRDYRSDVLRAPSLPGFCFNSEPSSLKQLSAPTQTLPSVVTAHRVPTSSSPRNHHFQSTTGASTSRSGDILSAAASTRGGNISSFSFQHSSFGPAAGLGGGGGNDPLTLGSRGWVEPHPRNIRRVGQNTFTDFPTCVIQSVLNFVDANSLHYGAVYINHNWSYALRISPELSRRRKLFCWSGLQPEEIKVGGTSLHGQGTITFGGDKFMVNGNDGKGILRYMGLNGHKWHRLCPNNNPGAGSAPAVLLTTSVLGGENVAPTASNLPQYPEMSRVSAPELGRGFQTPAMPYAWCGMDFGRFRVRLTHYTLGTSTDGLDPLPIEWELQGCVSDERDVSLTKVPKTWGDCHWVVLDKQTNFKFDASAGGQGKRSHTFAVGAAAVQGRGPMKKLRIVQTGRNTQWGMNLTLGSLEFYGQLFKAKGGGVI